VKHIPFVYITPDNSENISDEDLDLFFKEIKLLIDGQKPLRKNFWRKVQRLLIMGALGERG
jgi:hypothetical protein